MAANLPIAILLQRKSIRMYPNDVTVGLYYSKDLKRYFAISDQNESVLSVEEVELDEQTD